MAGNRKESPTRDFQNKNQTRDIQNTKHKC